MQTVKSLNEYLEKSMKWIYWVLKETVEGRDIYDHICIFCYTTNQSIVKPLQDPTKSAAIIIKNSWLADLLHTYADELGKWLHSPESIGAIETFWKSPLCNMNQYIEP
ncbi:MAG: hypothetical protein Q9209_000478, partial [Squamulea sp. 1 TL-2023]